MMEMVTSGLVTLLLKLLPPLPRPNVSHVFDAASLAAL
jgi:hypothetical protein